MVFSLKSYCNTFHTYNNVLGVSQSSIQEKVKSHRALMMSMNSNNKIIQSNNNNKKTKAIAAIPMAGAIVTAAILLSGLSLIGSYQQPVLAQQQNMTGAAGNATNATMTGAAGNATNATMTGAMGDMRRSEEHTS